jgi:ketosteroid isomerase-like protein
MPPGEPAVVGKERIRARNGVGLDRFKFDMGITNEEVRVAGNWAFIRGTYKATLKPKQGGAPVLIDGKYMSILAKQPDGSWKIHRDIFNSNVASQ